MAKKKSSAKAKPKAKKKIITKKVIKKAENKVSHLVQNSEMKHSEFPQHLRESFENVKQKINQ